MKMICAWCKTELNADIAGDGLVSHGLCKGCAEVLRREHFGLTLEQFLDSLEVPVLVVDRDVRVLAANSAAAKKMPMGAAQLVGRKGGEILECENAQAEGGCGHSGNCKGCVIRTSVTKTFLTGEAINGAEAEQVTLTESGRTKAHFCISTARVDGKVLLRIDETGRGAESATGSS